MKKFIIILASVIVVLCLNKETEVTIPKDSIRFRVIANSNSAKDQNTKKKVAANLRNNFQTLKFTPQNIKKTRNDIKNNLPQFKNIIEETLKQEEATEKYTINYGMNYFPEKKYKGITYNAGEYESLVVTLGNGLGENFWCVLFPPLCLLEKEEEEITEVEYTSFVKELLDKYF